MNIEELQKKVKHECVMISAHEQSIQGCSLLYSAAIMRGDKEEADRLRLQIHELVDMVLDCRSRISYYSGLDVTD